MSQIDRDTALIPHPGGAVAAMQSAQRTANAAAAVWVAEEPQSQLSGWLDSTRWYMGLQTAGSTHIDAYKEPEFPCHEKMKGKDRPYADELKPHWERARKLGLKSQVDAIEKMALNKDIEELTRGAGYPEVSDRDLEALFEFPRLRRKVRWHNLKSRIAQMMLMDGGEAIVLRLKKDDASRAGVPIPFGAQLRMEEAKEKGFFDSFQVIYPNVITETALAAERARERDPALVGLAGGLMYLICSWDLPKDVEKAAADIAKLKALKIEF